MDVEMEHFLAFLAYYKPKSPKMSIQYYKLEH